MNAKEHGFPFQPQASFFGEVNIDSIDIDVDINIIRLGRVIGRCFWHFEPNAIIGSLPGRYPGRRPEESLLRLTTRNRLSENLGP